jgi:hypothetical protein
LDIFFLSNLVKAKPDFIILFPRIRRFEVRIPTGALTDGLIKMLMAKLVEKMAVTFC